MPHTPRRLATGSGYSLGDHGAMLRDTERTGAYVSALRSLVGAGTVVLDIGTGSGVLALEAARLGAKHVYAVEPDDVIQVARELAEVNGLGERITFLQGLAADVELPERAHVIVSDLRGALPLYEGHIPSIVDARTRLLVPGGTLVPRRDVVFAAVAEATDAWTQRMSVWEPEDGLDLGPARRMAANEIWKLGEHQARLLGPSEVVAVLDYADVTETSVAARVELPIERRGTAHALCLWFDAELVEGIGYSNAPGGRAECAYGRLLLPLAEPARLRAGDVVVADVRASLWGHEYAWSWRVSARSTSGETRRLAAQSTVAAAPLSLERVRRSAESFVPRASEDAAVDVFALSRMDGARTLGELARELEAAFPGLFATERDALDHVAALSQSYAR